MRMRYLGKTAGSKEKNCEALYATERGTFGVRGKVVTDPEALADARDLADDERIVEVQPTCYGWRSVPDGPTTDRRAVERPVRHLPLHRAPPEPRDRYNTDDSAELWRRFLAGELTDYSFMDNWTSEVRTWRDQGKRMARVRVVTEPLSDDARFLLDVARLNVAAGDEIRYLPRQRARELELGLPDEDYWIFDATTVAVTLFDEDDRPVGHELIDDPAGIVQRLRWFDAAWHYSVSREEFAAKHGVD